MRTKIIGALLYGEQASALLCEDGVIVAIGEAAEAADCDRVIEAHGLYLYPGLIDIHSHGCIGQDASDGMGLDEMAAEYLRHGVTTWYPTTMTLPQEVILAALRQKQTRGAGAHIPGFHIEGPYINEKYKGAQAADHIRPPSIEEFGEMQGAKIVTIAPELPGSEEFIRAAVSQGACVAIGHTDCDYVTAARAFAAGAACLTHTCNAMPPLLHREPGPIGAAMMHGGYAQVIADGIHLHPAMVMALYRMFGRERMILISDSIRAAGLPDGQYDLGGQAVTVKDGQARLTVNGALAGSTTPLLTVVQRAISFGIPARDAFAMASETPATMLGLNKGRLDVGYDADLLLCTPAYELKEALIL